MLLDLVRSPIMAPTVLICLAGLLASGQASMRMSLPGSRPYRLTPPMLSGSQLPRTQMKSPVLPVSSPSDAGNRDDGYYSMPASNWFFPGSRVSRADKPFARSGFVDDYNTDAADDEEEGVDAWQNNKRIAPPLAHLQSSRQNQAKVSGNVYNPAQAASTAPANGYSFFKLMG